MFGEEALLRIEARLRETTIPFRTIREPDAPYNGAATAIGLAPVPASRIKREARFLRGLPLFAKNQGEPR